VYVLSMDAGAEQFDSGISTGNSGTGKGKRNAFRDPSDGPTQERAIHTRHELLHAARRIFARDGFEGARLQDIAESAGKTRGALYAHFKDKEDLFFALIAQDLAQDDAAFQKKLRPDSTHEERIAVVTEHLEALVRDRQRALLYVEFKLYAARHSQHKRQRLVELHAAVCGQCAERKMQLVPEFATADGAERRQLIASFGALLDGLALNLYFDPVGLTNEEVHRRIEQAVRERIKAKLKV
jgi:AcrR family transcriptional regulator